jgi:hypothetical protein
VEDLKVRANEARSGGAVYVVKAITSPEPMKKRGIISPAQFAAQIAWKRKYLQPHSKRKLG